MSGFTAGDVTGPNMTDESTMPEIEIAVEVKARTPKALLVFDGTTECWIPRSQISDYSGDEDSPETIFISEWLAGEKGLI